MICDPIEMMDDFVQRKRNLDAFQLSDLADTRLCHDLELEEASGVMKIVSKSRYHQISYVGKSGTRQIYQQVFH